MQRQRIIITGIVQGVGFRPYIYQLARRFELAGSVRNDSRGVTIEVEGAAERVADFIVAVEAEKPPLAVIQSLDSERVPTRGERDFRIEQSRTDVSRQAQIAPDTFVCDDCLRELFDPADRRYRYPFINCTNCGPRYTIVTGIPYDRPLTTMADFPLCAECLAEYDDPASRRFHAQPNACPRCGPQLRLLDARGRALVDAEPLLATARLLADGRIVAIKGLGGYHLAVDATNEAAVRELRRRKHRDEKPFALMASDLDAVRAFAEVGPDEEKLLTGTERPIVLLRKQAGHEIAEAVAPQNRYFGVMLPYTPLHHLLLASSPALVMTSANLSDEPIAFEDDEAQQRLAGVADAFLIHNRRIYTRTDDSIARVMAGRPLLLRRSRGFVPRAIALQQESEPILAVGGELKSCVCLTRGDRAFLSQHIGDLKNLEVYASFKQTIAQLQSILEVSPRRIACDLHPDYDSTRYALEESGLPVVRVQHHHAHLVSCLAEHGCQEPAIGVIFDGIGYGADGHIWGGEFLLGDCRSFERHGHFRYQPMPGGDLATRQPWRMALSYLLTTFGGLPEGLDTFRGVQEGDLELVLQATQRRINTPLVSSCGRLFDAVAALLGLRREVSFEGQAAMQLEMIADPADAEPFPYLLGGQGGLIEFDPAPLINAIVCARLDGEPTARIAGRFHLTLAEMIGEVCRALRHKSGLARVVLSGGVFQNSLLTTLALRRLEGDGFEVLTHSLVPANDGGLALGQAAVAIGGND
jgi:hydrogenase maturation protein HypF